MVAFLSLLAEGMGDKETGFGSGAFFSVFNSGVKIPHFLGKQWHLRDTIGRVLKTGSGQSSNVYRNF